MKKRKFLPIVLCCSLAVSSVSMAVSALTFSDVENDATVAWAKTAINRMTDAGYILGYEDGTFRPQRAISKIESLLLMSRMLGADEEDAAQSAAYATAEYGEIVERYNTTYVDELSFLLYNDVLTQTDLNTYASATAADTPLYRYQAAILITKLMGAEEMVSAMTNPTLTYADANDIPAAARPYVAYVTEEGLMNGMGNDASGRPEFSPNTTLTRAQMATLLARLLDSLDRYTETGTLGSIDTEAGTFTIEKEDSTLERELADNTIFKLDGKDVSADELPIGGSLTVTYIADNARILEVGAVPERYSFFGMVSQINESADGQSLTIQDHEDRTSQATYPIADDCEVYISGTRGSLGDLTTSHLVYCVLENGYLTYIETRQTSEEISGILAEVDYDDENHVYITLEDEDTGDTTRYEVSLDGATISRNGETATYRQLAAGDNVTLRLSYGKITRMTVTSEGDSVQGVIEEIIISNSPKITVTVDDETQTYNVYSGVDVTVNGDEATIYDLRPGNSVTLTLESNEVREIESSTSASITQGELAGQVLSINTNYKVISIEDSDGNQQNIYYNNKTTFLSRDGSSVSTRDIERGDYISVTGGENDGVFEATIIILR